MCLNINPIDIYQLAIITPCFNPVNNWVENYIDNCKSIKNLLNTVEIKWILVDDGSDLGINTRDTERIAREIKNFEAIFLDKNFGKGYAVRKGMQNVQAETYLYTDIDFPYRNEDLVGMYERSCAAGDLLLASRNEQYYENVAKGRTLISKLFKRAIRFLFNIPTIDTQAGLKVLSQAAKDLLLQTRVNRYL
ncbi:MAG: glycosyltransferase family 2 protein, partial [Chitinophagales bacterium]|nr:glycosyltransferase family 2 protein [Chitinophagales bacterium]